MKLSDKAKVGFVDNDKGIGYASDGKNKQIWFTKCKAKDFKKVRNNGI